MTFYRGILGAAVLAATATACGGEIQGDGGEAGVGEAASEGGLVEAGREGGRPGIEGGLVEAGSETGLVDVTCASVAINLCKLADQCTGTMPGGICVVVADSVTICFQSLAACEEQFTSCASEPGGTSGVLPDPAACDEALAAGVCTRAGRDMEFTLPPSCASCAPAASSLCPEAVDAG
jgi:hypothetical protein